MALFVYSIVLTY